MSNEFLCPHCRRPLSFAPERAGASLACPYCGQIFTMSDPSAGPGDAAANQRSSPPVTLTTRPGGVTAIAVIGIVLAGLGLLGVTCLGAAMLLAATVPEISQTINKSVPQQVMSPSYFVASVAKMFVLSLALLLLSIGLLKGSEFARRAFQLLALLNLVLVVVTFVPLARSQQVDAIMSSLCGNTVTVAYYVAALIYLRTQSPRAWFARRRNQTGPPPPSAQLG